VRANYSSHVNVDNDKAATINVHVICKLFPIVYDRQLIVSCSLSLIPQRLIGSKRLSDCFRIDWHDHAIPNVIWSRLSSSEYMAIMLNFQTIQPLKITHQKLSVMLQHLLPHIIIGNHFIKEMLHPL